MPQRDSYRRAKTSASQSFNGNLKGRVRSASPVDNSYGEDEMDMVEDIVASSDDVADGLPWENRDRYCFGDDAAGDGSGVTQEIVYTATAADIGRGPGETTWEGWMRMDGTRGYVNRHDGEHLDYWYDVQPTYEPYVTPSGFNANVTDTYSTNNNSTGGPATTKAYFTIEDIPESTLSSLKVKIKVRVSNYDPPGESDGTPGTKFQLKVGTEIIEEIEPNPAFLTVDLPWDVIELTPTATAAVRGGEPIVVEAVGFGSSYGSVNIYTFYTIGYWIAEDTSSTAFLGEDILFTFTKIPVPESIIIMHHPDNSDGVPLIRDKEYTFDVDTNTAIINQDDDRYQENDCFSAIYPYTGIWYGLPEEVVSSGALYWGK